MIHLYTLEEVADRFRVSRRTMQELVKKHPFYRVLGRRKLFSEADISALYGALPCPSNLHEGTDHRSGTSVAPSEASLWTKAQALFKERQPKRSERAGNGRSRKAASSGVVLPLRSLRQP